MTREAGRQKEARVWGVGWKYFPYAVLKVYMKSPGINFLDFFAI